MTETQRAWTTAPRLLPMQIDAELHGGLQLGPAVRLPRDQEFNNKVWLGFLG